MKITCWMICAHILNHTSNEKSDWTLNIPIIISSIVMQFYQKNKTVIYENVEIYQ